MSMDLMFITNDVDIAVQAQSAGVDRIFIDLERRGKLERQGHLDTHISSHCIEDIGRIRAVVEKSKIITRINPLYSGTGEEIDDVITYGTDIIMLPMFTTCFEVEKFIKLVNGRAKVCLLLETPQAMVRINDILQISGIDEIHIGLNDLHLGLGLDFMFELLSNGVVEQLGRVISSKGIKWGFGGIARIGQGMLPAECIIGEHVRLGSSIVILSRTFHERITTVDELNNIMDLKAEVKKVRTKEKEISTWTKEQFIQNQGILKEKVRDIVSAKSMVHKAYYFGD